MSPLRPLLASVLLAALAMGGIVLPVAHDVAHGGEQAELEEVLATTHGDHHHHQLEDDHGTEAQPHCPDEADLELACAFCSAQVPAVLASAMRGPDAPVRLAGASDPERRSVMESAAHFARGPPAA